MNWRVFLFFPNRTMSTNYKASKAINRNTKHLCLLLLSGITNIQKIVLTIVEDCIYLHRILKFFLLRSFTTINYALRQIFD